MHDASVASERTSVAAASGSPLRWAMSIVLLIAITTAFFDRINVAVLFTNAEFHADIGVSDPASMGLLMTAFVLPYGISAVLFSIFGDYFGPRRTLSGIAAILAATMAAMGALSSYPLMLAGSDTPMSAWNSAFVNSTATLMRSKKAVVIAIRSTIDIAQRNGLPAAAAALVLSDATLASCTCGPSRDLSDHR